MEMEKRGILQKLR